jgi:glycosyltransferase involved in cell wall biosynthesis
VRVAINALFLVPPMGGLETYLRELSRALVALPDGPRLTLFLTPEGHDKLAREAWSADVELVRCERLGRSGFRALSELFLLGPLADRRRIDVVHSIALTAPLFSRAARVLTVADVTWITHPTPDFPAHRLWRAIVPRVTARADEVITISEASARSVARELGVRPERLHTTLLGAGTPPEVAPTPPDELRARLGLGPGPIVLNVGQKGAHRNLDRLIRALARVRAAVPDAQLVLPGPSTEEIDAGLRAAAAAAGIGDAVHVPGYVATADLEGLYAAAAAVAVPSLVEGFGLPVLEAMQRGTPVACTRDSAPGEIAGDAALTFDPTSAEEIAAALVRLLAEPELRGRLGALGRERAATFTWERCAGQTLAVYRRALA